MKLKRMITFLSVAFLFSVLLIVLSATCAFAGETTTRSAISIEIDKLEAEGKYSNDVISSILVDFSNVSTPGAITMTVYEGIEEDSTVKSFSIAPLPWKEAEQQLVKYALGNIANLYHAEYDTDITCKTYEIIDLEPRPRIIIPIYVYGPYKAQAIAELFNGIPACFIIEYYPPRSDDSGGDSGYSGNMSVPVKPIPTPAADYSQNYLFHYNAMHEVFEAMMAALETNDFVALTEAAKSKYFPLLFLNFFRF